MNTVTHFFNSSFFIALVTLIAGLVALYIYYKRKIDRKKDAANIILLEIKNAETKLSQSKESIIDKKILPETIYSMRTVSWDKYSYLFVRDFTDKEWDNINTFYEKCQLFDKAVEYGSTYFKKNEEQTRINLQSALSQYIKEFLDEFKDANKQANEKTQNKMRAEARNEYRQMLDGFAEAFMSEVTSPSTNYFYHPRKAFSDAEAIVQTVRLDISTSSIGIKLEQIITQNLRTRMLNKMLGKSNT